MAAVVVCVQVLSVNVDASNLPRRYTRVVYDQCFGFPRILVFFLLGTFQVGGWATHMSKQGPRVPAFQKLTLLGWGHTAMAWGPSKLPTRHRLAPPDNLLCATSAVGGRVEGAHEGVMLATAPQG